eukprot:9149743-Pyramimonas_sp.AAC.1
MAVDENDEEALNQLRRTVNNKRRSCMIWATTRRQRTWGINMPSASRRWTSRTSGAMRCSCSMWAGGSHDGTERGTSPARADLPSLATAVERPGPQLEGGPVEVLVQSGLDAAGDGAGEPPRRRAHERVGGKDER